MNFDFISAVTFFALFCVVAIGAILISHLMKTSREDKIKERAKRYKHHLVMNKDKGVVAICLMRDFFAAEMQWVERAYYMAKELKDPSRLVTKPVILVNPTFTFSENGAEFLAHTGSSDDAIKIYGELIHKVTRVRKDEVSPACWKEILDIIIKTDKRLFIPFSSVAAGMDMKQQVGTFGGITPDTARQVLIPQD